MKNIGPTRILTLFSILLLSAFSASGQNIEGVWAGKIWQAPDTEVNTNCVYIIKLEQNGNNATGQAIIECIDRFAGKVMGEFEITVNVTSDGLDYKDLYVSKTTQPSGSSWCIKEGKLFYDSRKNRLFGVTEGYVSGYGRKTPCNTISFDLYRKTEPPKSERPAPKGDNSWAGNGTGIVIDAKGIIATNYHVVQDASGIEVDFGKGDNKRSYKCEGVIVESWG